METLSGSDGVGLTVPEIVYAWAPSNHAPEAGLVNVIEFAVGVDVVLMVECVVDVDDDMDADVVLVVNCVDVEDVVDDEAVDVVLLVVECVDEAVVDVVVVPLFTSMAIG
jgi:hypothetical protein